MTTTEELVGQVNKILDDIGIDMAGLFESFDIPSLVFYLNRNMEILRDFEEELSRRVGETVPSVRGIDKKEKDPHIRWLYKKKHNRILALERLRSAIVAHKMALALISANYSFYIGNREIDVKTIKKHEELKKIKVVKKPFTLGRLEILPHLAYSGDVLKLLGQESIEVREAFKLIKSKLREKGVVRKKSFRIEVEYWEKGRLKKTRIDLPTDADIESELRQRFGKRFRWRVLSYVKTKGVLINNHYTVDNLALAYAAFDPEKGPELLGLDLFRYYFLTSEKERENLGLYPDIKLCIDCHYSIFDLPFMKEKGFRTGFGSMMIIQKCEIEKMLSGKRSEISNIPNYLLGGAILYGISPFEEEKVAELLGLDLDKLVEAIRKLVLSGLHTSLFTNVEKFEKFMPKSDKAKRFLELLQG
ncbi:DUF530 domain-containing protein [Thermococcus sp. M39]|uniref:DUF530 family protein n=1 Tax=Thermococcus sp. M39 TaxID=1638262 RepID=UPI00143CAC3A|nr:DUF530 family protein [Thermococcus sp. M39]NJE07531.1 DUF530 domain-containing protein [Thermococcus sp. M39]